MFGNTNSNWFPPYGGAYQAAAAALISRQQQQQHQQLFPQRHFGVAGGGQLQQQQSQQHALLPALFQQAPLQPHFAQQQQISGGDDAAAIAAWRNSLMMIATGGAAAFPHQQQPLQIACDANDDSDVCLEEATDYGQQHAADDDEAENARDSSSPTLYRTGKDGKLRPYKTRTLFTREQMNALEASFNGSPYPDIFVREQLGERIGLPEKNIQIWFKNRRARDRRKPVKVKSIK